MFVTVGPAQTNRVNTMAKIIQAAKNRACTTEATSSEMTHVRSFAAAETLHFINVIVYMHTPE
jgi:hypothetical protein